MIARVDLGLSPAELDELSVERFVDMWDRRRYLQHQQAVLAALPAAAVFNVYSRRKTPVTPEDLVGKFVSLRKPPGDPAVLERKLRAAAMMFGGARGKRDQ